MVSRGSFIPQPTGPPPPPPPPPSTFAPLQPNHPVDSSDVPPIPANAHRSEEDSPYADMGNPWIDSNSPVMPSSAQAHDARMSGAGTVHTNFDGSKEPDVLRPGWSGQNTPRSSLDSEESRDFWESSDDENEESKQKAGGGPNKQKGKGKAVEKEGISPSESREDLVIPSPLQIKRKPVAHLPLQDPVPAFTSPPPRSDFASNNPFRRSPPADQPISLDLRSSWMAEATDRDTEQDLLSVTMTSTTTTAAPANSRVENGPSSVPTAHHTGQIISEVTPGSKDHKDILPPQSPSLLIPVPKISSPFSEQPPLIPVSPKADGDASPWSTQPSVSAIPSPIPFSASQKQITRPTNDLLDRGNKADGRISLGDELKALPNAGHASLSQVSLLEGVEASNTRTSNLSELTEQYAPPPGPPPSHFAALSNQSSSPPPPVKPPRPALVVKPLTEAELLRLQEQRNETYQIKHFNWFDHRSGKLRMSSMLTQNKNGPCPLLALVNALILGASDESQAALDDALKLREQVTLGLIIETLMDELLSSGVHLDGDLPDVDELNKFLMKLRTGMNMNPRFRQPPAPPPNLMDARNSMLLASPSPAADQPGNFEPTQDNRLYSAFGIKTVHGWLPEPQSEFAHAFVRSAPNYEDAQVIQFGEEELDFKLTHGGLTPQEQQLWQDIVSIKDFFRQYPTQLTPYGLNCIRQSMRPGSFAILFRNDHFSTIYKHPQENTLYTLITDAGYADRAEVIWESLVDISGQQSEFFSGDFHSVSHSVDESSTRHSSRLSVEPTVLEPLSPREQQEQHDADFAMALQLQEDEEQRMRQQRGNNANNNGGNVNSSTANNNLRNSNSNSTARPAVDSGTGNRGSGAPRRGQGIPIPLRSNNTGNENRPAIPVRNQRLNLPAVNRPSDALDADAPPTYEEAARGKPYNPPLGSPLHPHASPGADAVPHSSSSQANLAESGVGSSSDMTPGPRRPERRQSAYNENFERYNHQSPRLSSGTFGTDVSPAYHERYPGMPGAYVSSAPARRGPGIHSGGSVSNTGRRRGEDENCTIM